MTNSRDRDVRQRGIAIRVIFSAAVCVGIVTVSYLGCHGADTGGEPGPSVAARSPSISSRVARSRSSTEGGPLPGEPLGAGEPAPSMRIRVAVTGNGVAPPAQVELTVTPEGDDSPSTCTVHPFAEAAGWVEIGLPTRSATVRAAADGFAPARLVVDPRAPQRDFVISIEAAIVVLVRVVDAESGVGVLATVSLQETEPSRAVRILDRTATTPDGRASLAVPTRGSAELCVKAESRRHGTTYEGVTSLDPTCGSAELLLRLPRVGDLVVRCVGADDGSPVEGASVEVGGVARGISDENGVVRTGLPVAAGLASVVVSCPGRAPVALWVEGTPEATVEVVAAMPRGSKFEGRVFTWDRECAPPGTRVELLCAVCPDAAISRLSQSIVVRRSTVVDGEGRFRFDDVPERFDPDRSELIVTTDDGRLAAWHISGGPGTIDVRLSSVEGEVRTRVRVRRRDGSALNDPHALIRRVPVTRLADLARGGGPPWTSAAASPLDVTRGNFDGVVEVRWVPAHQVVELLVWDADCDPARHRVSAAGGEIVLDTLVGVRGRVVTDRSFGDSRAFVQFWSGGDVPEYVTGTMASATGSFRLRVPLRGADHRSQLRASVTIDGAPLEGRCDVPALPCGQLEILLGDRP